MTTQWTGEQAGQVEEVVLLDEGGHAIGTARKSDVHHAGTPLHLAFSCYVFDDRGYLLLTRRALDKNMFPGIWTNTFCGHPRPGEAIVDAVRRRGDQELGLVLDELRLALPRFRYQAAMSDGVRENELCPVFIARTSDEPRPDPREAAEVQWTPWPDFRDRVITGQADVSVWCEMQVRDLARREQAHGSLVEASYQELPPAVR